MEQPYYQVNVPIGDSARPGQRGFHLLTGVAGTGAQALQLARETCEAALAAQEAGDPIPRRGPDGWGARGVRPGWTFDWPAASVTPWDCTGLARPYDSSVRTRPGAVVSSEPGTGHLPSTGPVGDR
ncbi:hypothetical protein [Kitasatospora sp. NPDC002040]|uniref:hypothetical protein n=1 Tax=Kitasatospora sp. NPDC002040 TaxID=3154661 RepID=UPI0033195E3B